MSFKEYVIILFASLAMAHSGYASTPVNKKNALEIRKIENKHNDKKPKPKVKRPEELKKVTKK